MESTYKIILPLKQPTKVSEQAQDFCINELVRQSGKLKILTLGENQYAPSFKVLDEYTTHLRNEILSSVRALEISFLLPRHYSNSENFVHPLTQNLDNYKSIPIGFSSLTWADVDQAFTIWDHFDVMPSQIFNFICITQIAIPGSLSTYTWEYFVDGDFKYGWPQFENFMADIILRYSWPRLQNIPIDHVLIWFENQGITFNNRSNSSTSRAAHGLTYLFNDSQGNMGHHVFWSLFCLESLFISPRSTGITSKLKRRVQKILGRSDQNLEMIGKLYDYRSRFVHGDLDIFCAHRPIQFSLRSIDIDYTEHNLKLNAMNLLSLTILIATFQFMIQNNLPDTGFNVDSKEAL